MRRSKLEMYVDVLNVLAQRGPENIAYHVQGKPQLRCPKRMPELSNQTKPN